MNTRNIFTTEHRGVSFT